MGKKSWVTYVALAVVALSLFGGGFLAGQYQVVCKACKPETVDFSLFWDAYGKLQGHFIDPSKISDQEIMYGAISGMAKSLGDPYTDFFDPKQAKAFQQDLSGSFEGIGAEVGIRKEQLTVIAPLKGSPAENAGLQSGDQIVEINSTSTFNMSVEEAVSLIRGKKGSQVTLGIFREGWQDTQEITITRDTIKITSLEWEMKENKVAHLHIYHFDQSLAADFRKAANEMIASGAEKIILDLRNNPGGYLEISQDIAGWFLKPGQTITIEDFGKGKEQQTYRAEGNGIFAEYPTVVLVNKGSASASEILAGALRDNRGVQLVGEKSFGKGSVQEVITLQDGKSFLKVTVAKWLTPKGTSISEVGLTPDIKIEAGDDAKKDPQLEKALEIVNTLR